MSKCIVSGRYVDNGNVKENYYFILFIAVIFYILALIIIMVPVLRTPSIDQNILSSSILVLELFMVMFTIGISILGFFGYKTIRNTVREEILDEIKKEIVDPETDIGRKFIETIKNSTANKPESVKVD